jgi:hypothetical protein
VGEETTTASCDSPPSCSASSAARAASEPSEPAVVVIVTGTRATIAAETSAARLQAKITRHGRRADARARATVRLMGVYPTRRIRKVRR